MMNGGYIPRPRISVIDKRKADEKAKQRRDEIRMRLKLLDAKIKQLNSKPRVRRQSNKREAHKEEASRSSPPALKDDSVPLPLPLPPSHAEINTEDAACDSEEDDIPPVSAALANRVAAVNAADEIRARLRRKRGSAIERPRPPTSRSRRSAPRST